MEEASNKLKANPETIYDIDSISARIELLIHCGKTISIATTELTNKIQKAHIEIGLEITKAVAKAINPFESVEGLKEEESVLDSLIEKVSTYPDLTADDTATIYYKSKLDKTIWNTRINRDKYILNKKSFETYKELNKAITKAVGIQLNPASKCIDIDNAITNLNLAYETALSSK
ncbi:CAMP factor family pore-forming toxin [Peptostreptococcus russellii]|uniref:CAMP factor family pore-forming toxin n=1 Tax=Peptostreptococcus russellii TaxID=215200 RepID=UPI000B85EDFA|nr:CAMP factor family pore-forming toxin [Peptostreptococcus russellii]